MLRIKSCVVPPLALAVVLPFLACSDSSGPSAHLRGLAFAVQPASTDALSTLATVRVSVLDAQGRVATSATNAITLRLRPIEGLVVDGLLQGTITRQAVNGVATFSDLQIHFEHSGYVLEAEAADLVGAASAPFDVSSGPPATIVPDDRMKDPFEGAPGSTLGILVQVADAYGNPVFAAIPVNFAITAGGGKVEPSSVETNGYGLAASTLTLGPEPGPNVVEVTSDAIPGAKLVLTATGLSGSP